jgi:hypothetical protein
MPTNDLADANLYSVNHKQSCFVDDLHGLNARSMEVL